MLRKAPANVTTLKNARSKLKNFRRSEAIFDRGPWGKRRAAPKEKLVPKDVESMCVLAECWIWKIKRPTDCLVTWKIKRPTICLVFFRLCHYFWLQQRLHVFELRICSSLDTSIPNSNFANRNECCSQEACSHCMIE